MENFPTLWKIITANKDIEDIMDLKVISEAMFLLRSHGEDVAANNLEQMIKNNESVVLDILKEKSYDYYDNIDKKILLWLADKCYNAGSPFIENPDDVINALKHIELIKDREQMFLLHLNTAHKVIDIELLSIGVHNKCLIDPIIIFNSLIKKGTHIFMLAHNHPSGKTEPSPEDINLTERLLNGCELLNLTLLDHIIIGYRGNSFHYTSIRDEGEVRGW